MLRFRCHSYNRLIGKWALSIVVLPTLHLSTEREYVNVKFGSGLEPDAKVFRGDVSWLFWSFGVKIIYFQDIQGVTHVR